MHARKRNRPCKKEKCNLTSASTEALKGLTFAWLLAWLIGFSSLIPYLLRVSCIVNTHNIITRLCEIDSHRKQLVYFNTLSGKHDHLI